MPKEEKGKAPESRGTHPYASTSRIALETPKEEGPSMQVLLEWLEEQGVWISDKMELRSMTDGTGWAIYALEDIDEPQVVGKIPRSAILSTKTSALSSLLPPSSLKYIPSIIHLSLVLLYELRQGQESRFYGYLQSLPRGFVSLAALWDVEEEFGEDGKMGLEWLKGTEVERERKRVKKEGHTRSDLSEWLQNISPHLPLTKSHPSPPTLNEFLHAYSLVSSRVFQVDRYHKMALVPFADLFNHKEENDVHFESDDYVCEECGSLPACAHDDLVPSSSEPSSAPIPSRLAHLPPQLIPHMSTPGAQTLDIALISPVSAGAEVFNTYGENISAAKMLLEWGFVDESEEVEGARLFWSVEELFEEEGGGEEEVWKKVAKKTLKEVDEAEDDDDGEEKLLFVPQPEDGKTVGVKDSLFINADGQVSATMFQAILLSLLATDNSPLLDADGKSELEELLDVCPQLVESVWLHLQHDEDPDVGRMAEDIAHEAEEDDLGNTKRVCERLVGLMEERVGRTKGGGKSVVELLDEADALPKDRRLTRMAMILLVDEKRMIEVAISRWKSVLEVLSIAEPIGDESDPDSD